MSIASAGERGTTINRVRLRGTAGLDAMSARLRASRLIEQVAHGVALPHGAILCVRHLGDPRPGRVNLAVLQPPPPEWARAVAETLADLVRRAARPARGAVPGDAAAVIFDDRAQMLACLAADWCRGAISAWWWRALLGGTGDIKTVLGAWRREPAHVAAAIDEVARMGCAAAFVGRLAVGEIAALLDAIVMAHGLDRGLRSSERLDSLPTSSNDVAAGVGRPANGSARHGTRPAAAPWQRSAPEACAAGLRLDQQLLLGVALTLRRDPARARARMFPAEVLRWRAETDAFDDEPFAGAPAAAPTALPPPVSLFEPTADATAVDRERQDCATEPSPAFASVATSTAEATATETRAVVCPSMIPDDRWEPAAAVPGASLAPATFETNIGGVFYLLNVALALGLYGDFSAPLAPRLDVSIWRLTGLLAAVLLRGRPRRDAAWGLLTDLAGPDPPSIRGIAEWRLDPAWLTAFPEQRTWRWSAAADRVRVRHPAGFLIVDVARSYRRSAADQVRDEMDRYRTAALFRLVHARNTVRGSGTVAGAAAELARWTRWHALYVRARLARALGLSRARAADVLCRHRARVTLSLTHVDVTFSLAELPIAVRLSGLDRDPGWIPAADRIVSFRYD